MSDPGIPEVFCHCFQSGLRFSCRKRKLWSGLVTVEAGSLLAARGHFVSSTGACFVFLTRTGQEGQLTPCVSALLGATCLLQAALHAFEEGRL